MIDYMMWPWFERLEMFELNQYVLPYFQIQDMDVASIPFGQCNSPYCISVPRCLDETPELKKWTECMMEDPTVKAVSYSPDTYKAFYKTYIEGQPNYDYGL